MWIFFFNIFRLTPHSFLGPSPKFGGFVTLYSSFYQSTRLKITRVYDSVSLSLNRKLQKNSEADKDCYIPTIGGEWEGGVREGGSKEVGSVAKSRPEFLSRSQWKQIMLPSIWRLTKTYSDQHSTPTPGLQHHFNNTLRLAMSSRISGTITQRFFCSKSLNPIWNRQGCEGLSPLS